MKNVPTLLRRSSGFTLAELIVVTAILSILSAIGFLSFQGYSAVSRDTAKISELNNFSKAVELAAIRTGRYPVPNSPITYTWGISGGAVFQQGTAPSGLSDMPSDVVDPSWTRYAYSVLSDGSAYQFATTLESPVTASSIPPNAYADGVRYAMIQGNYLSDPSLPSLITVSWSVTDGNAFSPSACFVTNWGANQPFVWTNCVAKSLSSGKEVEKSLVGYWDMETICSSWSCDAGNDGKIKDLSGNGNHGSFSGGMAYPSSVTDGVFGKGLSFTNSGHALLVNDSGANDSLDLSGSFTVEATFRDTRLNSIFLSKGAYPDYNYKLDTYIAGNYEFIIGSGGVQQNARSDALYSTGSWSHVAGTYDGKNMILYSNGIKRAVLPYSWTPFQNDYPLTFGKYFANTAYSLNGTLDEVKIYSRALSDKEIRLHSRIAGFP